MANLRPRLAADPRVMEKSGGVYGSWTIAREYRFTDVDGSRPDLGKHIAKHRAAFMLGQTKTGFRWSITRGGSRPKSAGKRSSRNV